jgi:hypothetical protein
MPYKINTTTGNLITEIPDGTFDTDATSLTLIGRNSINFGEVINENFVKLLENFNSTTAPEQPLIGQIWYDSSTGRLNVYDGNVWRPAGGPIVSPVRPTTLITGDLWINNETNQLFLFDGEDLVLAGPVYTAQQGVTGFKVITVLDTFNRSHTVCELFVDNALIGIFSRDAFTPLTEIPGFSGNVKVGFTTSNFANVKFDLIASKAESILKSDGNIKTAEEVVFSNEENILTEKLVIQNNDGLTIGATENFIQKIELGQFVLENQITLSDIDIRTRKPFGPNSAVKIDATNDRVGIFRETPQFTLDVAGTLNIDNSAFIGGDLRIGGSVTIEGDSFLISSTTIEVADKNIILGQTDDSTIPTDIAADGGGITLKGAIDKTITYTRDTNFGDRWDLSENINIPNGKAYRINNVDIINQTTIASTVVNSNLTSVGSLNLLQMNNGILIAGTTITSPSGLALTLSSSGFLSLNNRQIRGVSSPTLSTDVANKGYVDSTVYARTVGISIDITNIDTVPPLGGGETLETRIANVLTQIFPIRPANVDGSVQNGTFCRVHCTKTTLSNSSGIPNITISKVTVDKNGVLEAANVVSDLIVGSTTYPAPIVTMQRKDKLFRVVSNSWVFQGDLPDLPFY